MLNPIPYALFLSLQLQMKTRRWSEVSPTTNRSLSPDKTNYRGRYILYIVRYIESTAELCIIHEEIIIEDLR